MLLKTAGKTTAYASPTTPTQADAPAETPGQPTPVVRKRGRPRKNAAAEPTPEPSGKKQKKQKTDGPVEGRQVGARHTYMSTKYTSRARLISRATIQIHGIPDPYPPPIVPAVAFHVIQYTYRNPSYFRKHVPALPVWPTADATYPHARFLSSEQVLPPGALYPAPQQGAPFQSNLNHHGPGSAPGGYQYPPPHMVWAKPRVRTADASRKLPLTLYLYHRSHDTRRNFASRMELICLPANRMLQPRLQPRRRQSLSYTFFVAFWKLIPWRHAFCLTYTDRAPATAHDVPHATPHGPVWHAAHAWETHTAAAACRYGTARC